MRHNLLHQQVSRACVAIFLVALLVHPLGRSVAAQSPEVPPDTVAADSLPADSSTVASPHDPRLYLFFAGALVVTFLAPASAVLTKPPSDTTRPGFLDSHISAYVTAGYSELEHRDAEGAKERGWAHSHSLEFLRDGLYGEVRAEHLLLQNRARLQAVRLGYLFQPNNAMAGGLTVGYRRASSGEFAEGLELGLPLLLGLHFHHRR